jgi:RNA polymerase sigma-70 factor, ECF subfamily
METRSSVSSYLLYLGVPAAQAQELTQETYLRLYQTMRKGQDIQNARAWLFRVAHNLGVKSRVRERSVQPSDADWERFLASPGDSPERQLLDRERMKQVAAGLEALSPQQRRCLYLRTEGLRYREISDVLGISLSTVNEFVRRAIARLTEAING